MGIRRSITDWKRFWNTNSKPVKPIVLEQLEPRILLSGDGLLNIAVPEPLYDPLLGGMEQVVQYAELQETYEEAGDQLPVIDQAINQEPDNRDIFRTDLHELIAAFFTNQDDTSTNEPVGVLWNFYEDFRRVFGDLSVNNIGPAQVNADIAVLVNRFNGNINGKVGTADDGSHPVYVRDAKISIEENTPIEIRGPPPILGDAAMCNSYIMENLLSAQSGPFILSEGQVLFLGSGPSPSELHIDLPTNMDAADTLNTDQLWPGGDLGLNLTGNGLTVGIWEATEGSGGNYVRNTHQELTGRVSFGDTGAPVFSDHATHVAGTIAASGVNAAAHGMASQIDILSYSADSYIQEMDRDASLIVASNHSYGAALGWALIKWSGLGVADTWIGDRSLSGTESEGFGKYDSFTQDLDEVLYDNPNLLSVWSAGNDRNDRFTNYRGDNTYVTYLSSDPGGVIGWSGPGWYLVPNSGTTSAPGSDGNNGTGYDSLPPDQTAKNSLVVGAIDDITADPYGLLDVSMTPFSSWGPTDDGRVKPDVVANGLGVFSSIAAANDAYSLASGTSSSAPNVTGTAALLIQHYENLFGQRPTSATIKGLLIHTAFDAGNPGPDFSYGWGVVDAAAAATFLDNTQMPAPTTSIFEDTYSGVERTYYLENAGTESLKATIVWTDPESGPQSSGIDVSTPVLKNDLDLWITDPNSTTYYPWTLDAAFPADPAVRTDPNHVDNVEQVLIDVTEVGTYTIHVGFTGGALPQDFSLVVSAPCFVPQPVPYIQTFDSGMPGGVDGWWYYSDNEGHIEVVNGRLRMDDTQAPIISSETDDITVVDAASPGPLFGTEQVISTQADGAHSVYARDLDGDGDNDVLSASHFDKKIAWYENLGGGAFGGPQVISTGADRANSVYSCDLDGDGDNDVLSASAYDDKIAWYANLGGGAFGGEQVISTQADGAVLVYACDLDGDGDNDVLSASAYDNKIAWYENLGGGAFGGEQVISTQVNYASSVYACDLDGDGDNDVLSASRYDDKIAWYENLGGGSFGTEQVVSTQADGAMSVYACDLDGDGNSDVLSASSLDDKIAWYKNLGGGTFGGQQVISTQADAPYTVYACDLDGDGDNDVLSASWDDDKIAWYENLGGGTFGSQDVISTQADAAFSVYACDLDGDGDNDVLSASYDDDKIAWYENLSQGPQILLSENFNDGNYNGWQLVDQGTVNGPMSWSAATGVMVQSSNVYSLPINGLPKLGTYAFWQGGASWTDYKTTVTIRSEDDDAIGIMFRYQDENNYYRFSWNQQQSSRQLVKCQAGQFSLLAEDSVPYVTGQNYQLEISAQSNALRVSIDDSLIFSVSDSSLSWGTIGLYSWGNAGSYFDDILVESIVNQAPVISSVTATPSLISDAETSQLQVNATDPDGGPNPLTYSWTVQGGEGSLSDASIANPLYTPPDVSATQTVTLTVDVSDGVDTTSDTVDITVTDVVLLSENFNDGNYDGWSLVDQGTVDGPMAWSAATGIMIQSSNVYSLPTNELPKLGTYAFWQGGTSWTDYKTTVTIRSEDNDAIGVMFRYQDENNYYRFNWNQQQSSRQLVKCQDGQFTLLAEDSVPYVTGQNYQLEIVAQSGMLQVSIDGSLIFSVNDSSLSSGRIALYSWGNVGSYFDDVTVEYLPALSEDFNDGNYDGWQLVDQGTIGGPMAWSAATGVMVQSSNVYSLPINGLPKLGTYAFWQGGSSWTDYETTVTIKSDDDDAIGVMFRYQDENNYYRFSWNQQQSSRQLIKCEAGQFTLLAEDSVPYVTGQNYQLQIVAQSNILQVSVDGSLIFSVNDSGLSSGTIALYSWGNAGSYFDDIVVKSVVSYAYNEAILHMDLSGATYVMLTLDHWNLSDESDALPDSFVGHYKGDGIALSVDGEHWVKVTDLTGSFTNQSFALDPVVQQAQAAAGSSDLSCVRIKFQQYDDDPASSARREFDNIMITMPEIEVLGNNQVILDGDTTPSLSDHTDFGGVYVASGSITRTFTVKNVGFPDLELTGSPDKVVITGSGDFTVTQQPTSPVAANGGTTTFEITFNPSSYETKTATIVIANNDSDENPYDFVIRGTGVLFGTQQVISAQVDGARCVYACDLDGDGDNDVLSASNSDDTVAWYENLGGGTFGTQQVISTQADGARCVYVCDLDEDGDNDILSASWFDNKIAWYENLGGGTFGSQQVISTQMQSAISVYACDLDGDGDKDVLSGSWDGKVAWYENLGGGTFDTQQVIDIHASSPESVYACDLDSDGDNDILVACGIAYRITWYENLGGGTFGGPQDIVSGSLANSVYACDLDGDGDNDILSAYHSYNKIAWYENAGGGNFGNQQVISTQTNGAESVYGRDLDGDGDNDVLSADESKIAWYENLGDGTFGSQQVISAQVDYAESVYACDLDGDGDNDVLSASFYDDKVAWYENLRSPGVGSPEIDVERDGTDDVHAHSFGSVDVGQSISQEFTVRNEGDAVLVVIQAGGLVSPFSISPLNSGDSIDDWLIPADGTQTFTVSFSTNHIGDYSDTLILTNNDLDEGSYQISFTGTATGPDIEVLGNTQVILDGDTTPSLSDHTDFGNAYVPSGSITRTFTIRNVGSEDLNLTGSPDRVLITGSGDFTVTQQPASPVAAYGGTTIFEVTFDPSSYEIKTATISIANDDYNKNPYDFVIQGKGSLFGSQQVINTQAVEALSVYSCDLDGDGDNDVLWVTLGENIAWYENLGGGTFSTEQVISTQLTSPSLVHSCDLDGDGDNDVLLGSYLGKKIVWYENLGGGTFGPEQVISEQRTVMSVYSCDLDGDGDNDVLSALKWNDRIAWYENLGGGTFGGQQTISGQVGSPTSVYSCDLDGDDDNDVLSASSNKIAWYENLSGGAFGSQQIISTLVSGPESVYACDLDGDGDNDVLSASYNGIAWYENLGGGTFGGQQVISIEVDNPTAVYACDLDGDGDNDVLSASYDDDKIAWYENLGGGTFGSQQVISSQADYARSVYACDLDGDGDNDVLSASLLDDKIAWYENLRSPGPGLPEIDVERDGTDDVHAHSFGTLELGQSVSQEFTVRNEGDVVLVLTQAAGLVSPFSISPLNNSGSTDDWVISAGGIKTFTVSFSSGSPGNYNDTLVLTSNDSDEGNYLISFTGIATGPEIEVLGNTQLILDGDMTPSPSDHTDFGVVNMGATVVRTFTIMNIGSEYLNLTGSPDPVAIIGSNDFTVTQQPTSPVAAYGGTTTFQVRFDPSSYGTKTATISIANNDTDENPYDFVVQGICKLFGGQQVISTQAAAAQSVYACDLDGDGDNDVLSASRNDDKIAWYENLGGGTFGSQQVISTQADAAFSVYACDLDGDGDNDVLSASRDDDKIAWYENLGGGTFGSQQVISTQADAAVSVYACDLDSDGDNDVLSASTYDNKIAWYQNLGGGAFGSQQVISTQAGAAESVYACDLDGDGDNDVLSASHGDDKIAWYENLGGGTFGSQQVISQQADCAMSVYACDLDGDGDNDVLSASEDDDKIAWYENLGGGTFGSQQLISTQADIARSVYACDLDGDGDNDVLSVSASDDEIAWYENLGSGTFGNQQVISTQADNATSVYACDLDGDGDNDVLSASWFDSKIAWYENLGPPPAGPQVLLSEDFNDGNYDGWELVDQGTVDGPMAWSAATGVMVQSSNVYSLPTKELPKLGTYAFWQAGTGWTDYKTTVTIKSQDNDAIGVMFRYQDENNYYRFNWNQQQSSRQLVRCQAGQFTLLAEDSVPYVTGQSYQLEIVAQSNILQVSIDGSLIFSVNDSSLSWGTIALYSWGNAGSYFDDIVVESLPALSEDFDDGNYDGWQLVDQGTVDGPMAWSAATGVMVQSSNVYSLPTNELPKLGTYAFWQGGNSWTDYKTTVTIGSEDNDAIGVMFRYQDENNYYRFNWNQQQSSRQLVKCQAGQFTLLAEDSVPYVTGQNYQLEIVAQSNILQVSIDGSLIFSVNDSSLSSGTIALYSWGNAGSYFDDIVVEHLPALSEDFNDGNYDGWQLVDQGTIGGPMAWSAATGVMVQSSNVYSLPINGLPKLGTYGFWQGGTGWTDYKTTVMIRSQDDDAVGVMFRYQDENNYYRFSWNRQQSSRQLVKCQDGQFTILAEDSVPYVTGQNYQLEIVAQGATLQVSIDGSLIFSVSDSSLSWGTIALYSWGNAGSYFDDILVESAPG